MLMLCFSRMCWMSGAVWRNASGQCGQGRGLRPVWVMLCRRKAERSPKAFGQLSHLNGFSPVWTRMWTLRSVEPRNARLQTRQKRGLLFPEREVWDLWANLRSTGSWGRDHCHLGKCALINVSIIESLWPLLWGNIYWYEPVIELLYYNTLLETL